MKRIEPSAFIVWAFCVTLFCILTDIGFHPSPDREFYTSHQEGRFIGEGPLFFKPLDINSVTLEELVAMPGIGEKRGQALLNFRDNVAFFLAVDELDSMDGPFPKKVFDAVMPYFYVSF